VGGERLGSATVGGELQRHEQTEEPERDIRRGGGVLPLLLKAKGRERD